MGIQPDMILRLAASSIPLNLPVLSSLNKRSVFLQRKERIIDDAYLLFYSITFNRIVSTLL